MIKHVIGRHKVIRKHVQEIAGILLLNFAFSDASFVALNWKEHLPYIRFACQWHGPVVIISKCNRKFLCLNICPGGKKNKLRIIVVFLSLSRSVVIKVFFLVPFFGISKHLSIIMLLVNNTLIILIELLIYIE